VPKLCGERENLEEGPFIPSSAEQNSSAFSSRHGCA
jgi:hypothetical protein